MAFTANFPRIVIETRFPFAVGGEDWLFSIITPGDRPVKVRDFPSSNVFSWQFADCDFHEPNAMTAKQAQVMAAVINKGRASNKNIWVHCTAGACRSGAVVEVLRLLGWTVVDEFSPARMPNRHVFNILRLQFPKLRQAWETDEWINWAVK